MIKRKATSGAGWNFDNSFARLPQLFFSRLNPTPVQAPRLVLLNDSLATSLGINAQGLRSADGVSELAGTRIPQGGLPIAQAYAGHQFGYFTMLGDGRALLLGEHVTPSGEKFDVQLKGSGKTPYSRRGDGRAALGPMLREYIISEAMHSLGIATTRSLAVVMTGEQVFRDTEQPGAILTRVAASHLRVGTFQYASQWGDLEDIRVLADYTLHRHFPYVEDHERKYLMLLREVIKRQALLIAKWQLAGFIHGVMNTDNMSIVGETIDYGPCAFMDAYDPETVFSSIDTEGRYAYGNQPQIAAWNLTRFAETLLPLLQLESIRAVDLAQEALADFAEQYHEYWLSGMRAKLGIIQTETIDETLIENLLDLMRQHRVDYTNTFLDLTFDRTKGNTLFDSAEFGQWRELWQARLSRQTEPKAVSYQLMRNNNPALIPRNHRVEAALEAAVNQGDCSMIEKFLQVLANPYAHSSEQAEYAVLPEQSNRTYRTFCGT